MSIHYVKGRDFKGRYKPPLYMVMGTEDGQVFRRVYRSRGQAEKFKKKVEQIRGVRHVSVVQLPEKERSWQQSAGKI